MTDLPAELLAALIEAMREEFLKDSPYGARNRAVLTVNRLLPVLVSWLADHDAEVRQQGRNEAAQSVKAECCHGDMHYGNFGPGHCPICTHLIEAARGGSDLKGQDDGD